MKKTLFLAALMALLFCSCKQTYLRLGDNQELCTVQSVVQTPDGFFVCLEKDTIFCEEDPQIEQNSIVIFDHDSMCLLKLYYSYATDLYLLKNDQNVCLIESVTKCVDKYIVCTKNDHYVFDKKPDFKEGDIVIIKPDMSVLAPFDEPTYIRYKYVHSAYDALSVY